VAGHSSFWTQAALADLADFIVNIYFHEQFQELVALRRERLVQRRGGDRIVDMSLLYLWWVAHHNISDVRNTISRNLLRSMIPISIPHYCHVVLECAAAAHDECVYGMCAGGLGHRAAEEVPLRAGHQG
jgi:hypothetical protein